MSAFVGSKSPSAVLHRRAPERSRIETSIARLSGWLEANDYKAYDVFDGLNARYVRPLTFETKLLRTVLQQGVRRFPLNLRPILGISKSHSSKGMGFLARAFMRLKTATGDAEWDRKAQMTLQWLIANQCQGYNGSCWGNHFDYQSRSSYVTKDIPSVVWTSLIGHAFVDAFEHFHVEEYLKVAESSCEHIIRDLGAHTDGDTHCIHYFPTSHHQVHNANVLGASLLARIYAYNKREAYRVFALKAFEYTARNQMSDGAWHYGECDNLRWVDNFHTAYVLDSFKWYVDRVGDAQLQETLTKGYRYWKSTFFLSDGTPKYYKHKTQPIDIQCCSQAIDTLVFFSSCDSEALPLATKIAGWTIEHMQDPSGYFYYRRYSSWLSNKTPTLHWGQATTLCALAGLYQLL